ncbi:protein PSK SIMULATOR 2-like isoform X1 [Arachis stenosperma]|uniref:protein PSK SIMULATOR 2-like isoform X1 n=1 Tax=Arachis stenosperma TaxID=217475 RepID=UPI0025ACE656|nr:protein PSK SIMULATOR 2-like isoform X1 [Arachis stenosperma]
MYILLIQIQGLLMVLQNKRTKRLGFQLRSRNRIILLHHVQNRARNVAPCSAEPGRGRWKFWTHLEAAILFHSHSEENIQFLKKEIFQSEGVQKLVSTDTKELLSLVEADKREEFNAFSKEVVRFGNMCKEHQWHNLDRFFSRLGVDVLSNKDLKLEAEKTMQELITLGHHHFPYANSTTVDLCSVWACAFAAGTTVLKD